MALCVGTMFISVIFARCAIHPIENTETIHNIHIIHTGTIHYLYRCQFLPMKVEIVEAHVIAKDRT